MKALLIHKKLISLENILSVSIDRKEYSIKIVYCFGGETKVESINYNDSRYNPNEADDNQEIDQDFKMLELAVNGKDYSDIEKLKEEIKDLKIEKSFEEDSVRRLNLRLDEIQDIINSKDWNFKKIKKIKFILENISR